MIICASFFTLFYQAETAPRGGGNILTALFPFILVFAIFYLLIIRPSRTKQKRHQQMVEQLKSGDKIVTSGGIYGTVMGVQKDRIEVKIASNVKIDITKSAVGTILSSKKSEK